MSRVANNPINIPAGVTVSFQGSSVKVTGAKGELEFLVPDTVSLNQSEQEITIAYDEESKESNTLAGTTRALVNNMVIGVSQGFEKKLELRGVGYKAKLNGKSIELTLGFSHPVIHQLPDEVEAEIPTQTEIILRSFNKQILGQVAAEIRNYRRPEPYKGKGVRYSNEYVKRKEAKKSGGK
ncbi:MAG: 50S ribosomal protein L6 [Gammaproteobacteria bacterium]